MIVVTLSVLPFNASAASFKETENFLLMLSRYVGVQVPICDTFISPFKLVLNAIDSSDPFQLPEKEQGSSQA